MGWSCRADAGDTWDRFDQLCRAHTGQGNVYDHKSIRFFLERSNREHHDGAITGTVYQFVGETMARRAGSFRIEGDGSVTRGPAILRQAALAVTATT